MLGDRLLLRSTPSGRLERYIGSEALEQISRSMHGWYGPPVAVKGIPGAVFATGDGDFIGPIEGGAFAGYLDFVADHVRNAVRQWSRRQQYIAGAGIAGVDDLAARLSIARRTMLYQKTGPSSTINAANSLWRFGAQPVAGSAASGQPGGTVPTRSTTGALGFLHNVSPATQHYATCDGTASVAGSTLLLYDRLFAVAKAMNSTATEAVTGVPARYQSTSPADEAYCGGNFLFMECGTVLPATAHNWTVCTYTDQDGLAGTLPSLTGNASNAAGRLDMPLGMWFAPLASGDSGIRTLTQMQCSALVATGAIDFVIGRPLAIVPFPVANMGMISPGFDAMNLVRIFDDACLAFLEMPKPTTGATIYSGLVNTVVSA